MPYESATQIAAALAIGVGAIVPGLANGIIAAKAMGAPSSLCLLHLSGDERS
jgi:F0F1-type ATP synthase membrane subunit c/vacuolar-type H+-ATPase subunit K